MTNRMVLKKKVSLSRKNADDRKLYTVSASGHIIRKHVSELFERDR